MSKYNVFVPVFNNGMGGSNFANITVNADKFTIHGDGDLEFVTNVGRVERVCAFFAGGKWSHLIEDGYGG